MLLLPLLLLLLLLCAVDAPPSTGQHAAHPMLCLGARGCQQIDSDFISPVYQELLYLPARRIPAPASVALSLVKFVVARQIDTASRAAFRYSLLSVSASNLPVFRPLTINGPCPGDDSCRIALAWVSTGVGEAAVPAQAERHISALWVRRADCFRDFANSW